MKKEINDQKEVIITSGIIFVCLILFAIFPVDNVFQRIISSITFLFLIPFLYVKIILKKSLFDFGWRLGGWKQGIKWGIISSLIFVLVHLILYKFTAFSGEYVLMKSSIKDYFKIFLIYEMLVAYFLFLYSFFFQGFIGLYFSKKIGLYSIILQAIIFFILLDITKEFRWDNAQFIILAPLAGLIAYQTKSIFYSYIFSLIAIIISDAIYIKLSL